MTLEADTDEADLPMKDRAAELRFYEELNDFLPRDLRKRSFRQWFKGTPSVKDVLEPRV